MTDLHLSEHHKICLLTLIRHYLPDVQILVYGSRTTGRSHSGSDLDIALRLPSGEAIPMDALIQLIEAVGDSNIPFLVEIRDWTRLPESFRTEIARHHILLQ